MTEIKIDNYLFSVDIEKTKEYYQNKSLCECEYCQYFHSNISGRFPKLETLLAKFGIDITKPDETAPIELDGEYDYTFVGYTVCGTVLTISEYEIDIQDNRFISISVYKGFSFPNSQKGEYFSFDVFGISLPCDSAKEIKEETLPLKIKKFFRIRH